MVWQPRPAAQTHTLGGILHDSAMALPGVPRSSRLSVAFLGRRFRKPRRSTGDLKEDIMEDKLVGSLLMEKTALDAKFLFSFHKRSHGTELGNLYK